MDIKKPKMLSVPRQMWGQPYDHWIRKHLSDPVSEFAGLYCHKEMTYDVTGRTILQEGAGWGAT